MSAALAACPAAAAGQARWERPARCAQPRRCLVRAAAKNVSTKGSTTTKGGSASTKGGDGAPGFKFDGSMQRWVRDDRFAGKSMTTVQPLSGTAYTVWPVMHTYLTEKGLKQVDEEEALALARKGAVIVDVRLADDYKKEHIEGAVSVPMFRLTQGTSNWDNVKRFVMGSLAMKATERDPDFLANFGKAMGGNKRKTIIVACAVGGTLDTVASWGVRVATTGKSAQDPDRAFGRETRSLKACYELMQAGYTNVIHLKGGLSSWRYNGYPTEGSNVRD
ncbi:hypothetical protein COHA_006052 [Chlorella ohadii]|uniref:Rhodanese domain-containing protein n=1 Tax=Chlorella ohadii TaxID=2649997 RepID=A0AAD5DQS5_9CHLO|nr:hypothetical protein COHA_006052 [Chlorella ohadii]